MAEMLVDSTKLDACLNAEADAIRAKTGDSNDLTFDFANNKGFSDAIAAIPSGGSGGWNVDVQTIEVTGPTATVDRMFDNFILVAQINSEDFPAASDRPAYTAYWVMMAWIDGNNLFRDNAKRMVAVATTGAGSNVVQTAPNGNSYSVGATSINFSPYWALSGGLGRGTWTVMQVEIPNNVPFYSFAAV